MSPPSTLLPHPTVPAQSEAADAHAQENDDRFIEVQHTSTDNEAWHFQITLPENSSVIASNTETPSSDGGLHTLACFASPDRHAQFEVSGHALSDEVDAADWLESMLGQSDREIVSRKAVQTFAGRAGDVVATWRHDGVDYVGRFVASKWDARLFVVACSCAVEHYATRANDFLESLAGFHPLQAASQAFAEETLAVDYTDPVPWSAALPNSWSLIRYDPAEEGAYFEATHGAAESFDADAGALDGKLTVALVRRSAAKRPRDASKLYLDALRGAGFDVEEEQFESEAPHDPFTNCWYMSSAVQRDDTKGQLHCRVAMNDQIWLVGAVLGPARDDDPEAWMRNKRALDLVSSTVSLTPAASQDPRLARQGRGA